MSENVENSFLKLYLVTFVGFLLIVTGLCLAGLTAGPIVLITLGLQLIVYSMVDYLIRLFTES